MNKLFRLAKIGLISLTVLALAALLGLSLPSSPWQAFSVQSGSMEPAIDTGALVIVRRAEADQLKPGEVITYTNPANRQQIITHRLVSFEASSMGTPRLVTRGDANDSLDPAIAPKAVIGRVSASLPYLGNAVDFMKSPVGLSLFIYLPALWVVGHELRRLTSHYRQMTGYRLRGHDDRRPRAGAYGWLIAILALPALAVWPAQAGLRDSVAIQGTTISAIDQEAEEPLPPEPLPQPEPQPTTITCNIESNIDIDSQTNQSASSGSVTVEGNRSTDDVSSGDASASNSTTNNIQIDNQLEVCPPAEQ